MDDGGRSAASEENRTTGKPVKRAATLIAVPVLGAALFMGYRYSQAPAEGTVTTASRPSTQVEADSSTVFTGKAFAVELPGGFTPRPVEKPSPPTSELHSFSMRGDMLQSRQLNIIVKRSPPAIFQEESALRFRQASADYVSSSVKVAGLEAVRMGKADGSEITYFVPGRDAYAIIAATTTGPGKEFDDTISKIIKSFRWL